MLTVWDLVNMIGTFLLVTLTWIFFRADNVTQAVRYITHIFSWSLLKKPEIFPGKLFLMIFLFMIIEWMGRKNNYAIAGLNEKIMTPLRWTLYYSMILSICFFSGKEEQFIYFQF
jgi:hypothetical protein